MSNKEDFREEDDIVENEGDVPCPQTEEAPALSPEEELKIQVAELNDKYLRLFSEFENYRKRSLKERLDLIKTASESVVISLLPVLDDFERALKSMENIDDAQKEGISLIYNKMKTVLEHQGLKSMGVVGEEFNADLHDAVAQVPAVDEATKGKIIEDVQKGYYLCDKVIRHAKVVVAC